MNRGSILTARFAQHMSRLLNVNPPTWHNILTGTLVMFQKIVYCADRLDRVGNSLDS